MGFKKGLLKIINKIKWDKQYFLLNQFLKI
jgi:hypothetical protein